MAERPEHKRTKSGLARSLLSRVASTASNKNNDGASSDARLTETPVVEEPATMNPPDASSPSNPSAPSRSTTTSSHRPHLSTTMSNASAAALQQSLSPVAISALQTPVSPAQGASIEQSVRLFKIFEALRSGDTAAISRALKSGAGGDNGLQGTTVLHLAIQCAEVPVIEYVLSQQVSDINARDGDGNTPLHIASMLGRAPVVKTLLEQKDVNDSLPNHQGSTPLDLARNPDIFQQLQLARSIYIDQNVRQIHALVQKGDYDGLEQLLSDPRIRSTIDVNGPDIATDPVTIEHGGSLLHEAARKKDTRLAQIMLLNGADPFRRDRKGKLPQDVTKDDRTRAILKKSPAAQAAQRGIQEQMISGDPSHVGAQVAEGPSGKDSREMKGYLKKWTNYTSGYKLRWFVLEDGVLSYYKHQDDAGSACRGAINMKIAKLHMDTKDKLAFEIHGKSSVKYHLKANHQVEAKRWFWSLNNAIQWSKDEAREEQRRHQQESVALRDARREQFEKQQPHDDAGDQSGLVPGTAVSLHQRGSSFVASSVHGDQSVYEPSLPDLDKTHTRTVNLEGDIDDDEEYGDDASSHEIRPASRDAFSITAQSAKLQLDLLRSVSDALQRTNKENPEMTISNPTVVQALSSYETAVGNLKGLLTDLLRISKDHEAYWQYRLEREANIRRLWEDSMARVAKEQEELENRIGESEDKRKRTKRALRDVLEGNMDVPGATRSRRNTEFDDSLEQFPGMVQESGNGNARLQLPDNGLNKGPKRRLTIADVTNNEVSDVDDEDDEEEFFDAIDAGEVEVVEAMPPSSPPAVTERNGAAPAGLIDVKAGAYDDNKKKEIQKSYKGYEDGLRKKLKLDADNRPKVSLWGILKSMIGKDMTKMTLPVSFNEPTSLLYRVVEDMEYTDLLNVAADRGDATERMLYVAGFAISEYASTIGRVAKPFNPLLGETYEYVRPDQEYRFFIEQVSHHPPVGAAYAESPKWDYYGESAVKSKFYGKSFEFNPLGTWFLHLRPTNGAPEELYTWKKVTSSVVGIITGNPTVDNYGPMEVKNWTTGEVCYLDFKPKGWKASSAFQVSGKVVDASGKTRWSIGGRWNDKVYARGTPGYEASVEVPDKGSSDQAFLVWEAHERPEGIPFNITPFVVTLNAIPDRLRPYLAPTDSRLRPDQRAMEEGEYDFAATEKNRLEEKQRATRRTREANGEEFSPRWFKQSKHPVTGEPFWLFNHQYWKVRDDVADGKTNWQEQGLEDIF